MSLCGHSKKTDDNSTDEQHTPQLSADKGIEGMIKDSNIYYLLQSLSIFFFLAGLNVDLKHA